MEPARLNTLGANFTSPNWPRRLPTRRGALMSWPARLFQGNPPFIRDPAGQPVRRIVLRIAGHRLHVRAVPVDDGIGGNAAVVAQEAQHGEHPPRQPRCARRYGRAPSSGSRHRSVAPSFGGRSRIGIDPARHPAPVAWKRDLDSTLHGHGGPSEGRGRVGDTRRGDHAPLRDCGHTLHSCVRSRCEFFHTESFHRLITDARNQGLELAAEQRRRANG